MDVDLDHAGVGRDPIAPDARIERRRIAFDRHGQLQFRGDGFHGTDQIDPVFDDRQRRKEYGQLAAAHLHAQGRVDDFDRRFAGLKPGSGRHPYFDRDRHAGIP
jgi:hypothetical protein